MKLSFTQLVFHLFMRNAVFIGVHEQAHLWGARLIGLYAEVRSTNLDAAYPDLTAFGRPLTWGEHVTFYGSGGFFTAGICLLFDYGNTDPDTRIINRWMAIESFVYGCFEAFAPRSFWSFGAMLGTMMALGVILLIIIRKKPDLVI